MIKNILFIFFIGFANIANSQYWVKFNHDNLDEALDIASKEGKKVFIDTYAPWCVPCKKMDKIFRDPKLADYFNKNFVNVKINMDGRLGKRLHSQFQVVFLPTLLFLEPDGSVIYRNDKAMSKNELLAIGRSVAEPDIYLIKASPKKEVSKTEIAIPKPKIESPKPKIEIAEPFPSKEASLIAEEKILFVLDSTGTNKNPEYLYNVAYLKLQLNEVDKYKIAEEYLSTQEEWTTPKNLNFIYDFLYSTDSQTFSYFINNKDSFIQLKGEADVEHTIDIMIHMKLDQGFPRPGFDEAYKLLKFIDPYYGKRKAYAYILDRYQEEHKYDEYLFKAKEYITLVDPNDDEVMFNISNITFETSTNNSKIKDIIKLLKKAISLNNQDYRYFDLLAQIYFDRGQKHKAMDAAEKAVIIAKKNNATYLNGNNLLKRIKAM